MKKAEILLMTLAIIATIGTALAFKVVKKGSHTYCYLTTTIQPPTGACTSEASASKAVGTTTVFFYTRKTAACNTLECPWEATNFED